MKKFNLTCACHDPEHTIRFVYDEDDIKDPMYIDYCLCDNPRWYKRVWRGIKYIFGFRSKYGHFGEVLIHSDEAKALIKFLEAYVKENKS